MYTNLFSSIPPDLSVFANASSVDRETNDLKSDDRGFCSASIEDCLESPLEFTAVRVNDAISPQAKRAKTEDSEETSIQWDEEDIDSGEDNDDHSTVLTGALNPFSSSAFAPEAIPSQRKKMKVSEEESSESSSDSSESSSPISPPSLPMDFHPKSPKSYVRLRDNRRAERPLHDLVRHSNFLLDVFEGYSYADSREDFNRKVEQDPSKKRQYVYRAAIHDDISSQAERALDICDEAIGNRIRVNDVSEKNDLLKLGFISGKIQELLRLERRRLK